MADKGRRTNRMEKVILMKTLLDLYEQNELFQNIVVQEYIDKLETKLKELL